MTVTSTDFPIGYEKFDELRNEKKIYIDKTSHLNQLLNTAKVSFLLRPRRFGKTLSMSMLENFLELNYKNPEDRSRQEMLFKGLKVSRNRKLCDEFMGRYPVVSVSLKDTDGEDFEDAMNSILDFLAVLFERFKFLLRNKKLSTAAKSGFRESLKLCQRKSRKLSNPENMKMAKTVIQTSLRQIGSMLAEAYDRKVVIIIDEYDVPLQKATVNGYYDEMLKVIRLMISAALKDNKDLFRGYVTGCLKIAHQSIFTGVNNFDCYSPGEAPYADFIGLTKAETENLLKKCGMENRLPEVLAWYDGYNGIAADSTGNGMLCPWSVLKFLSRALAEGNDPATFRPQNFWANSSGNDIIEICMRHPDSDDSQRIQNLIDGGTEEIELCEFTSYPEIAADTDFDVFATLMLHTGYLTRDRNAVPSSEEVIPVKIPNREITECFKNKARYLQSSRNPEWKQKSRDLLKALFDGDAVKTSVLIREMLLTFLSVRDTAYESVYHAFLLGVLGIAAKASSLEIKSNSECGEGFSDIVIKNKNIGTAVIIEFKKCDSDSASVMKKLCEAAITQIDSQNYDFDIRQDFEIVRKYGIVFHGKDCEAVHREYRREE